VVLVFSFIGIAPFQFIFYIEKPLGGDVLPLRGLLYQGKCGHRAGYVFTRFFKACDPL